MATSVSADLSNQMAGSNQVAEDVANYSVSTANSGVVVPFIGSMYADASGTVGTLQQVTVSINGLDEVFDVQVDDALAQKILKGFVITDVSATNFDLSAAEISVNMATGAAEDDFKAALADIIAEASQSAKAKYAYTFTGGASKYSTAVDDSLKSYLRNQAAKDTVDLLAYDTLSSLLEASDLLTFDIAIDASGAAVDMYTRMNGSGAGSYRKAIFAQISKANVDAYLKQSDGSLSNADKVDTLRFLPLVKGDKITFVYDVTVGEYTAAGSAPTSGAKITSVINDAATASAPGASGSADLASGQADISGGAVSGSGYAGSTLTFTTPTARRVALVVQLGSGGSVFGSQITAGGEVVLAA